MPCLLYRWILLSRFILSLEVWQREIHTYIQRQMSTHRQQRHTYLHMHTTYTTWHTPTTYISTQTQHRHTYPHIHTTQHTTYMDTETCIYTHIQPRCTHTTYIYTQTCTFRHNPDSYIYTCKQPDIHIQHTSTQRYTSTHIHSPGTHIVYVQTDIYTHTTCIYTHTT